MKILATPDRMKIHGRTIYRDEVRYLGYSASGVTFSFRGTKALATLRSDATKHDIAARAWIAVFYNFASQGTNPVPEKRIRIDQDCETIELFHATEETELTITIMKYSEAEFATVGIESIEIFDEINPQGVQLLPPPQPTHKKIEIFGDSITCGYGVEGSLEVMEFDTAQENPMKSYSMKLACALGVDVNLVSWNGKGIISEFVGEDTDKPNRSWLMPDLYPYADAGRERDYFQLERQNWEKWDFTQYQPDLIIIYLGTNDASYVRGLPERKEEYRKAYVKTLEMLHKFNPQAKFLCTLGEMDDTLCDTVAQAVEDAKQILDVDIRYVRAPHQDGETEGFGTFWHPTELTNQRTVAALLPVAKQMLGM